MSFICKYWEIDEENERKKVMGHKVVDMGPLAKLCSLSLSLSELFKGISLHSEAGGISFLHN